MKKQLGYWSLASMLFGFFALLPYFSLEFDRAWKNQPVVSTEEKAWLIVSGALVVTSAFFATLELVRRREGLFQTAIASICLLLFMGIIAFIATHLW